VAACDLPLRNQSAFSGIREFGVASERLHQRRNTMEKLATKVLFVRVAVASLCACAATLAQAGGNGNGGNGSGGAHGAATAGMTYHSEPVSSPWNRVPGDMSKSADTAHKDMPGTAPDDSAMSKETGQ
jgi:hypothetical protein